MENKPAVVVKKVQAVVEAVTFNVKTISFLFHFLRRTIEITAACFGICVHYSANKSDPATRRHPSNQVFPQICQTCISFLEKAGSKFSF